MFSLQDAQRHRKEHPREIVVTHANVMDATVHVMREKVFAWYRSPTLNQVMIVSDAGGVIPILENETYIMYCLQTGDDDDTGNR